MRQMIDRNRSPRAWYFSPRILFACLFALSCLCFMPQSAFAGLGEPASSTDYGARMQIDAQRLTSVTGDMIEDGTYDIAVRTDSSLLRVVDCKLTVKNGKMTAKIMLNGRGYSKLFMGVGKDAYLADLSSYIGYKVDAETGQYCYTVPVESLNSAIDITALSAKKNLWYDHQVIFLAASLPTSALSAEGKQAVADSSAVRGLPNGVYTCTTTLSGGSGRASLSDPCQVTLNDGLGVARIEWSSQYYDYMVVGSTTYYPVNDGGDSVFEIPISGFDVPIDVVADTTALSQPYEIEYQITFWSSGLQQKSTTSGPGLLVVIVVVCLFALGYAAVLVVSRRTHRTARERRK